MFFLRGLEGGWRKRACGSGYSGLSGMRELEGDGEEKKRNSQRQMELWRIFSFFGLLTAM